MSTTYGYTKQVESNQQGSKHTLAILLSKLRSSLGAAWEQARSRQEYTHRTGGQLTRAISPKKGTYVRRLTKPASLVHEHMFIDHRTYVHRPSNICSPKSPLFDCLDAGPHIRKQQCVGTGLFGNVLYRKL
jgi:hypothetical protein